MGRVRNIGGIFFLFWMMFSLQCLAFVPEKLDRGVVAVKTGKGVFISWRLLSGDTDSTFFDLYRDGVKINAQPLVLTNYLDAEGDESSSYVVETICGAQTEKSPSVSPWQQPFLHIHLNRPAGGRTPPFRTRDRGRVYKATEGEPYFYIPNDCSVGDVDGDGTYEIIVKWNPSNARDNSSRGYTGEVYLDCYKLDGTQLWRIALGKNIRAGAHYTQFLVYDLDGDGRAEVVCKTAPGTIDGGGNYVLLDGDDPTADYRSSKGEGTVGMIMSGPEYLTVFDGETGVALATVPYLPGRDIVSDWGDAKANRSERYLACVAYLDGQTPSLVMCRGYYTQAYVAAYDFDGKALNLRWFYRSEEQGSGLYGEGAHSLAVGDVDGDGCDEIIYGAAVLNNDGTLLYRTGLGHGDALHLSDFMPDRQGLEIFMVHEGVGGADMRDASTGEILFLEED
ncbi:MAG: rhamnogalacturonan lyase [Porphyromonadaceae bacterium]|nr:rhamnogalacturonan lyase [Porphyromonadaceae bacterium]